MTTLDAFLRADRAPPAAADPARVLALACTRQEEAQGSYAGAVTPPEAWMLLQAGAAKLIDVRTAAEVRYVGRVPGARHVEWNGRDLEQVARFVAALDAEATRAEPTLFLCRSAVRSHHAAAVAHAAGYAHAFNVLEGFEGQRNHAQQRGLIDGWRRHGLPWLQD